MAGRALAFSDPVNAALVKERFVGVVGDDWYTRRRQDAEGRFYHHLVAQGPRKWDPEKQHTVQGIYVATAGGKLLGFAYGDVAQAELHKILVRALETFDGLPEAERRPGAASVKEAGEQDARFVRAPPAGALILSVHTRLLELDEGGRLRRPGRIELLEGDAPATAQPDRMWLTEQEQRSLVPARPRVGDVAPLNEAVVRRLARFHLIDNTRGEMPPWRPEEVLSARMDAIVEVVSAGGTLLRVEGAFVMSRRGEAGDGPRSFAVRVTGRIHHDRARDRLDRFDMVALGDHRGSGPHMAAPPPRPHLIGIAFEMMDEGAPFARIPPHGARRPADYLGR